MPSPLLLFPNSPTISPARITTFRVCSYSQSTEPAQRYTRGCSLETQGWSCHDRELTITGGRFLTGRAIMTES
ncbi:hypothetical protein RRG08_048527 [Elysia crispata]|uniref:Uncharacterized protein n=1 Tax=Elysia crispata TaxID=231223 RepID=A0AAE1EAF2_9GAST|nr:hypothetical protein RRG08_048527 [Elysia crispata]